MLNTDDRREGDRRTDDRRRLFDRRRRAGQVGLREQQPDRHRHRRRHQRGAGAELRSEIDLSITDPYFLDRNLVAGFDLFYVTRTTTRTSPSTASGGRASRSGSATSSPSTCARPGPTRWSIATSTTSRTPPASTCRTRPDTSLLSQLGTTLTLDYRDSRSIRTPASSLRGGTDFAGLGGNEHYVRTKVDGTYFIPLEQFTGDPDWGIAFSAGAGYLFTLGYQQKIIDNFFLGGDNLARLPVRRRRPARRQSAATASAARSSGRSRPNCASRCRSRPISA